jgi:hypothetical protein
MVCSHSCCLSTNALLGVLCFSSSSATGFGEAVGLTGVAISVWHRIVRYTRMAEEARGWYLSQRMFRRSKVMLKVLSRNCCSASHSQAGVQEHTSGEGNAQNRRQLMPALNLSSAVAIAILLEPTSLSDKAAPSRRGQTFETL